MAYVKIIYQNSPSTATPINAQNLNHMDDGIAENDRRLNELETAGVVNKFNGRSGNITPTKGDYDIADIGATDGQDGYVPVWRNSGTEQEPNWGFEMEQQGGSGHKILDADGSEMAQEDSLQFADAFLTDDSVNGRTVVENIKEVDPADYASTTDEGIIVTDDGDDALIGPVSDDYVEVTADGEKTYATLLNELFALADLTKINEKSSINLQWSLLGADTFLLAEKTNTRAIFTCCYVSSNTSLASLSIMASNSTVKTSTNGTIRDASTDVPTSGYKITLYYGNKKATVDLQTTANRCLMGDGSTVESTVGGDVESFIPTAKSGCTISSVTAAYTKKIGHLRYIYLNISIAKTAQQPQITLPFNCADMYMDISSSHNDNLVDAIVRNNVLYCAFPDSTSATVQVRCSGMVMC